MGIIKNFKEKKDERKDNFVMGMETLPGIVDVIEVNAINGVVTEIREWTVRALWAAEIAKFSPAKGAKLPEIMSTLRMAGFTAYDFDKEKYGIN